MTTRFENQVETNPAATLARLFSRLPETWRLTRAARRRARELPALDVSLELPAADQLQAWIEALCRTPHRRPGSPEGRQAEQWVAGEFERLGLQSVTADPIPIPVWTARHWSLRAGGEAIPCFYTVYTGFTGPEGVRAPLAYIGAGRPRDFARSDVAGRIAVAEVAFPPLPTGLLLRVLRACYHLSDPLGEIGRADWQWLNFVRRNFVGGADNADEAHPREVYWQAQRRGARGICLILKNQPAGTNTHYGPYDGLLKPMPALWVGKYEAPRVRRLARAGAEAELVLHGEVVPGQMCNVWGTLPGRSVETILVTSHQDSPFRGAVEDGAGMAQVLAQAAAWARVPQAQRPRTLVFVAGAGHFFGSQGGHAFARAHAELMRRTRVLIALEHLGGKEVRERGACYEETGRLALSVLFTTPERDLVASVMRALQRYPVRSAACIPANLLSPVPTSDAMGYVLESGVPVVSWIGCPYYLLDEHDTLDKLDWDALRPIAETVGELIKIQMVLP